MTGLKILLGFALCLSTGCSSFHRPTIESGRCTCPKSQVSFDVPPSPPWFQSKDLPDRFIPKSQTWVCTLGVFSDIIFVNDARNGAIAVEASKIWQDLGVLPPQKIEQHIKKELEKGYGAQKAPFVSNYDFKITAPYVCDMPLPLTYETFTIRSQNTSYRCEIRTYVYTINKDDTCFLRFFLWSAPSTYAQNKAALDGLVKSLQRTSPTPSTQMAEETVH
jgi:hypothetical protein